MARTPTDWESRIGRRVTLRDLHILSVVVRSGSMAKAASYLATSQSAVADAIANLEDALHVRLLDRSPQGIEPTIYANVLLKRGHAVFDELKQGVKEIEFLSDPTAGGRSEEHTSELKSLRHLVCRLLLEKKKEEK